MSVTRRWLPRGLAALLILLILLIVWVAAALVVYPNEYVWRVLAWRQSDVNDYLVNFPSRPLAPSPTPHRYAEDPDTDVTDLVMEVFDLAVDDGSAGAGATGGADDAVGRFLAETDTQALLIIDDDTLVFERYRDGAGRESLVTSFSVAKSFVSTLVGIAVDQGAIESIDDPVSVHLPELADRDPRFTDVTLRHLLTMSSGLEYQEMRWWLFNGDDPLTTYHPDQRRLCLEHPDIVSGPDVEFSYNKCHPQLLGLILERATGMSVTDFTQEALWDPLGMEYGGSWSIDSEQSGFEKLEAGLNARPIDFAKLGSLFLHEGRWNGREVVSSEWVALASGADSAGRAPAFSPGRYYGFMWWGWERENGADYFAAWGDHSQFVFVSPSNGVVIVRNGFHDGIDPQQWIAGFTEIADRLG
jgi:CubicO group peptidase (beta-lactamase class C family)